MHVSVSLGEKERRLSLFRKAPFHRGLGFSLFLVRLKESASVVSKSLLWIRTFVIG